MEPIRFDRFAKQFANRRISRRQALTTGGAGLAAASLAAAAGFATGSALDATPVAADQDAILDAMLDPDSQHGPMMLFVQTYQSGSITPTEGVDGRYTLTLEQGHSQTIYFSDRPGRIVGADPTPQFLEGLGFPEDNPPNAALVVETAPGETDIAVVELFNPLYDPISRGVTYEVEVLANWQDELEMGFHEAPTDLATLAPAFGSAQLFIDDCRNGDITCSNRLFHPSFGPRTISAHAEMCWNYSLCQPCEPYGHTYPDYCAGYTYWRDRCNAQTNHCGGDGCVAEWPALIMPACW